MANDEVLGPRKTIFILVIVVGCFAILWPRILSPLIVGHTKQQLQPNQFDRDAGCCEVMFGSELDVLELINEVCNSAVHIDGKISPHAAAECRKAVNETCGVDIAAFLKRTENVGKTSKILVRTMQNSNSSCLKEHFGVPVMSLGPHLAYNSWTFQDTLKQERSPIRGAGPHPALRERGRAIPAGAPAPSRGSQIKMPPNVRVRSPLEGYFELDIKVSRVWANASEPPPIPGMRPPLGSPGGPQAAPKSSMGLVMPIYTLCIIIFFVYTLSKVFFKSTAEPYEQVTPDPQFRRRVFRDDSRTTPDKLVVSAISGLVAEVRQQMETGYAQNQQTQERQDNTRPYTNGTVLHNSGPVHIIASEYQKESIEKEPLPENKIKTALDEVTEEADVVKETENAEIKEVETLAEEIENETKEIADEIETEQEIIPEKKSNEDNLIQDLVELTKPVVKKNGDIQSKVTADFIEEAQKADDKKTKELLEEALDEEEYEEEEEDQEPEKSSVKVIGMEVRAESADGGAFPQPSTPQSHAHAPLTHAATPRTPHEADEVKSIFLDTEIPQKSRVLVDFSDVRDQTPPAKHSPMVVSGKMTLSLIQDAPRDTPERDAESTVDDFTTASALTQDVAEREGSASEEEEEEIEEIEEEVEEELQDDDEELERKEVKQREVAEVVAKNDVAEKDIEVEEEEVEVEEVEVEEEEEEDLQRKKINHKEVEVVAKKTSAIDEKEIEVEDEEVEEEEEEEEEELETKEKELTEAVAKKDIEEEEEEVEIEVEEEEIKPKQPVKKETE